MYSYVPLEPFLHFAQKTQDTAFLPRLEAPYVGDGRFGNTGIFRYSLLPKVPCY